MPAGNVYGGNSVVAGYGSGQDTGFWNDSSNNLNAWNTSADSNSPIADNGTADLWGDGSQGLAGNYGTPDYSFGDTLSSNYTPFGSYGNYPTNGYYSAPGDATSQGLVDDWNKKTQGQKTWASVYGKTGSQGLADFSKGWSDLTSPLQKYVNNPIIGTLMSMNPISAIAKAAINGPGGVGGLGGGMLGGALSGSPVGSLIGGLAGQTAGNYFMGTGDSMPNNSQIGGGLGSALGYYSGNPYGSTIGGFLGSQAGSNLTNFGTPYGGGSNGTGNPGTMMPNYGGMNPSQSNGYGGIQQPNMQPVDNNSGIMGGLAALFASGQANKSYNSQINNLNGLFSQNSPYAQQLQQALDRKDAAAGRRSQYGTRAVELQAALAQAAAKSAPQLQSLNNQKIQTNNMLLATLMNNKGLGSLFNSGISDLKGLFNPSTQNVAQAPSSPFTGLDNAYSGMNPNLPTNYFGGDSGNYGG